MTNRNELKTPKIVYKGFRGHSTRKNDTKRHDYENDDNFICNTISVETKVRPKSPEVYKGPTLGSPTGLKLSKESLNGMVL